MSKEIREYLQSLDNSLDSQLAEDFALRIIKNPNEELKKIISFIDGNNDGIEIKGNLQDFVLLVLDKVNEMINDTESNIKPENLELIYEYINTIVVNRVPTFDKVTFTLKNAERNTQMAEEMLFLSNVLGCVDKIRLSCAEKSYDDLSPLEVCRERSFANAMGSLVRYDKVDVSERSTGISISESDDLKSLSRVELIEKNIIQQQLNKKIELLSSAIINIRNEHSYLTKGAQKDFETALAFMRKHYMAEYSASMAVCNMIEDQKTME